MKIAFIADIHLEKISSKLIYDNLEEYFFPNIEDVDVVVIGGDLFEKRVALNTDSAILANKFIHKLKQSGKMIIIIHGTLSHDNFQILSYSHLIDDKFKIFTKHTEFTYEGLKFLIIPEEYIKKEEYKSYFKKEYDFVFGHGMFDHVGFAAHVSKFIHISPVFSYKDFVNVKGYVVFGHIHTSSKYKNIIYSGSFDRFNHGEEEDKGFYIFNYEKDKLCEKKFIKNEGSIKFKTLNYSILPNDIEGLNNYLYNLHDNEGIDNIRIIIDNEISHDKYNNILSFMKSNNYLSIKTVNKKKIDVIKRDSDINKDKIEEYKKLDYMSITIDEIKRKHRLDYSREDISSLIYEESNLNKL